MNPDPLTPEQKEGIRAQDEERTRLCNQVIALESIREAGKKIKAKKTPVTRKPLKRRR